MSDSTESSYQEKFQTHFPLLMSFCSHSINIWKLLFSPLGEFANMINNVIWKCSYVQEILNVLKNAPLECQSFAKDYTEFLKQIKCPVSRDELCKKLGEFCGLSSKMTVISLVLLLNSLPAIIQSITVWYRLWKYNIDSIQDDIIKIKGLLNEAISLLDMALKMNNEEYRQTIAKSAMSQAKAAQTHLINTLKNVQREINYVQRMKRDLRTTTGIHIVNAAMGALSWTFIPHFFFNSASTAITGVTVAANGICAITDLCAAGNIDKIIKQLENDHNSLQTLQNDCKQVEENIGKHITI